MSAWIDRINDYHELPDRLVRYLLAVSVAGPVVAVLVGFALPGSSDSPNWTLALILAVLATLAERFPVHLTHKTHVNVATAVHVAMFLTLPPSLCCVLILLASASAQIARLLAVPDLGLSEPLFNIGQTALFASAAAVVVSAVQERVGGGLRAGHVDLLVAGAASLTLHLGNSLLVSGAAARHLALPFRRVWARNVLLDFWPHAALTLVGLGAAELGQSAPWLTTTFAIPAVLIHLAVRESTRLREDTRAALAAFVDIVELRDPYTAGHSRRVAETARLIAIEYGLSAEEADEIFSAGQVHDIGKLAISPEVLMKPGTLTDGEWSEMRRHPVFGGEVISLFHSYRHGIPLIRGHHEAIDGSGYPDGLKGDAIPLGARILAVADTFDALTSDRPYRTGMTSDRARTILAEGSGRQWDPAVIAALNRLLDREPCPVPIGSGETATQTEIGSAA